MKDKEILLKLINLSIKNQILNLIDCTSLLSLEKEIYSNKLKDFDNLLMSLNNLILNLKNNLKTPINNRKNYIEDIENFITDIKNTNKKLTATTSELILSYNIISIPIFSDKFNSEDIDTEKIFILCENIIENFNENSFLSDNAKRKEMSKILGFFKMNMTKDNFNDYLKSSLNIMLNNEDINTSNEILEHFKIAFYPFDYTYEKSLSIDLFNDGIENIPDDKYLNLLEQINDKLDLIKDFKNVLSLFVGSAMFLLNLTLYCVDEEYIFENEFLLKDWFNSLCNNINSNTLEIFAENLCNNTQKEIEKYLDDILKLNKKAQKIKNNKENEILFKTYRKIETNFYSDIEDLNYFSCKNCNINSKSELIENFINYVTEKSKNTNNINNSKLLKQCFLENILYPYSDEKFYVTLKINLDNLKSSSIKGFTLNELFKSLELFNFLDYENLNEHQVHDCNHHH